MRRLTTNLILAVLLLFSATSWAQTNLEAGKIYHFQNAHFTGRAITAVDGNNTSVQAAATNPEDPKQLWFVSKESDNRYIFRNVYNGYYLSQTAQNAWGLTETCTDNSNKFEYILAGGTNNTIRSASVSTNDNGYMHLGSVGQTNIQGWGSGSGGTQWTVSNIEYTDAILGQFAENLFIEVVGAALGAIFSDEACSKLNEAYASMTDEELYADANYQSLPTALRKMVKKLHSNNWAELTIEPADRPNGNNNTNHELWTVEDTWDSDYAKRFRVQMYEPYSIEGEVTSYLRLNAHCNMDNPTGIYANSGDVIYIMVEGDIAEGAELWLAHQAGSGATNYYNNSAYTQLHKGLNRVAFTTDGCQMWINYVVHTYNENGTTVSEKFPENRKLSNYKPLKIHIEGGHINGFFNAIGDFRAADSDTEDLWGDVDNDDDWNYYKARVALPTDFALLGHRQTLLFPFGSYDSEKGNFGVANSDGGIEYALAYHLEHISVVSNPNCYGGSGTGFGNYSDTYYPGMGLNATNGKINIMLEAWDRIMYSELATMGLVSNSQMDKMNDLYPRWTKESTPAEIYNYDDSYLEFCQGIDYSEYFNHHGCGVGAGSGYMSGGWRVCNYNYNTMPSIIGLIANEAGPTWGPAHEIGHQHQAVFNLNGQTEVTNNFFSNVAVWYMGMGTSRVNGSEGSLESVLAAFNTENNDLYTNNIWAITHLYYRLWLYYHLAGNNTQFWPRLFELCRQIPLENGGQINGATSLLRFYQHACDAAGEDLTEFFRAHGFFEVMDNRVVGDYSNAIYNTTQEQIDTAIEQVKEKGYPQNLAVLFINDGTAETTLRHDGTTKRSLWDNNPTAEYGSVNDFIDGDVDITTAYTATLGSDGNVTMSGGEGGVGFLILNENGEIISFSNKSTFELSDEALHALVSGKAEIVAVDDKSETKEAEVDLAVIKRDILAMLINDAKAIIDKVDNTYTRVGFYKAAAVAGLVEAVQMAEDVYESGVGYEGAYEMLYAEYQKVLADNDAKIPFNSNLTYIITNSHYAGNIMYVNADGGVYYSANVSTEANTSRWQFRETAHGVYNVYNLGGYYCAEVANNAQLTTTSEPSSTAVYRLQEISDGIWAIRRDPLDNGRNMHAQGGTGKIIGWGFDAAASGWYLTAVEPDNTVEDLAELQALMTKTKALVDEVATISYTKGEAIDLQTTNPSGNYYLSCNAPSSAEGSIDNLVDGATSNHFHTDYTSEPLSGSHYLTVNFGNADGLERFLLSYTTRSGALADFPKGIDVYGSHDGNSYRLIGTVEKLPQSAGTYWEATDAMISAPYKYLRFNVHANRGYWHMAEFDIYSVTSFESTLRDYYKGKITDTKVDAAHEAYMSARSLVDTASPSTESIETMKNTLQDAYNTLHEEYNAIINARKATLSTLVAETEALIATAGTVELSKVESMTLTTDNLYCNAPYTAQNNDDYSAAYVDKLTDDNVETFMHTDYSGTVATPHYLRVDLGENSTVKNFKFNYATRDNGNNCPTTIVVEGCNEPDGEYVAIRTLTSTADGLPNPAHNTNGGMAERFESGVISLPVAYRYIRFKVTGVEGGNSATYFVISEFGFSKVTDNVAVNDAYSEIVTEDMLLSTYFVKEGSKTMCGADNKVLSVDMLDAQIVDMEEAKTELANAVAQVSVDKNALRNLYNNTLALYNEMADGEGNVNDNYKPSALKNEKLAEVKVAIDEAKDKLDNSNSQTEVDDAKTALQAQYEALLAIKNTNVATTIDKSGLNTAIANANTLIAAIAAKGDDYYASVTGLGIAELSFALQQAENVVERFYLTENQYTETLGTLNACLSATQTVVNADCADRTDLETLIGNVNSLLQIIAIDGENKFALPLQATNNTEAFYIWCNDPAGDSQGVAGLIDKNTDGTANTGTFLGTNWGSDVPAYTHYIEVDLGVAGTIDQLTMDYTTRNSTHADQRPNAIKILGSNDKVNYTEIAEITEGLAVNANEKWSMAESLDLCGHYRYIRVAVGSERGYFHMADFNLYTKLSHTLKEYYTTAEGLDLTTLCFVLDEAKDAAAHYMTTEQYTAVYNKLNDCYTTADAVVCNDYTDRNELATLLTETQTLVAGVAEIDGTEAKIALQATDENAPYYIYCNAPGATNNYSGDNLGAAALLDVDDNGEPITATFLHTSYVAGSHDDALDHYLRVDMGEANLLSFKFRYTPRIGNTGNAPLVMLIEGSNDCVNFEEITTLTDMTTTYQSQEITNGKAYRYIRFMVKDTHNHSMFDDHKFFAMSHFEMTTCKTLAISQEYASPNLPVDVAANAYNEVIDVNALDVEHYLPSEVGTTAKDELQAAKDALDAAKALKNIPVKLTTDASNPVLYKIKINRSATTVLEYDGATVNATKQVAVVANGETRYQAWYFMQGTDAESNDDILILPYWNEGAANTTLRLGAASTGNSAAAVWAVESNDASKTKQNWYITFDAGNTAEGWWNIRPEGKDNYFSNNSGVSHKMGFWNSSSDDGSEFQFILDETDYSLSDAYYALYNQYETSVREVTYGTVIGTYTQESATEYNVAYNTAARLLETKNSTDDEYDNARTTLAGAYDALEYNGGLCRIRSAFTGGYSANKLVYVDAVNNPYFEAATDEQLSKYVWEFVPVTGGYKLKSLHTQSYVTAAPWAQQVVLGDEAAARLVTVDFLDKENGIVRLNVAGGYPLHAAASESMLVGYTGDAGSASAWYIEEITDVAQVYYPYTLTPVGYGTLMLGFDTKVPDGVTAYYAERVNGTNIHMEIVGEVIPANTPVVINGPADEYMFFYTSEETPNYENLLKNLLKGTLWKQTIEMSNGSYYILSNGNNGIGMYMPKMGNDLERFVNQANKAYLHLENIDESGDAQPVSFSFRGINDDGPTTDADVVLEDGEAKEVIYDLQGRKLEGVTRPGFYIVNGKKMLVK